MTLGLVSEAHSLAMIAQILKSDAARGAADGINAADIPDLHWDMSAVMDDVKSLSRGQQSLQSRITAVNARELEWQRATVPGSTDNLLQQKIHREMVSAVKAFEA